MFVWCNGRVLFFDRVGQGEKPNAINGIWADTFALFLTFPDWMESSGRRVEKLLEMYWQQTYWMQLKCQNHTFFYIFWENLNPSFLITILLLKVCLWIMFLIEVQKWISVPPGKFQI
jgi:hypothetical protein